MLAEQDPRQLEETTMSDNLSATTITPHNADKTCAGRANASLTQVRGFRDAMFYNAFGWPYDRPSLLVVAVGEAVKR